MNIHIKYHHDKIEIFHTTQEILEIYVSDRENILKERQDFAVWFFYRSP